MGRVIRNQRRGNPKSVLGSAYGHLRIERPQFRNLDYAERNGYIRGVVKGIIKECGRNAPVA